MTTYDYNDLSGGTYSGQYEGGNVVHDLVHTTVTGGPTAPPDANSEFTYIWFDGAREATELYQPSTGTDWESYLKYDQRQDLLEANIIDGQTRDVLYASNMQGEITQRDTVSYGHTDISGPHARYYYFGGIEMGDVSNDGTSSVNYAASITDHKTKPGTGLFQNGATTETKYADFDTSYDTINGLTYEDAPSSYTVQSGDTLESIAQQISAIRTSGTSSPTPTASATATASSPARTSSSPTRSPTTRTTAAPTRSTTPTTRSATSRRRHRPSRKPITTTAARSARSS